jgi:hypothetical protein
MVGNEGFDRPKTLMTRWEATIRRVAAYGGPILAVQDATAV